LRKNYPLSIHHKKRYIGYNSEMKKSKKVEEKKHFSFFDYGPYLIGISIVLLFLIALSDAIDI